MSQWFPFAIDFCEENGKTVPIGNLPADRQEVLVSYKNKVKIFTCWYEGCLPHFLSEDEDITFPEAWMPLPEPYKKKRKTYLEDFLEKYPDAPKDICGSPKMCPEDLYQNADCDEEYCDRIGCEKCWNREMEVK